MRACTSFCTYMHPSTNCLLLFGVQPHQVGCTVDGPLPLHPPPSCMLSFFCCQQKRPAVACYGHHAWWLVVASRFTYLPSTGHRGSPCDRARPTCLCKHQPYKSHSWNRGPAERGRPDSTIPCTGGRHPYLETSPNQTAGRMELRQGPLHSCLAGARGNRDARTS